MQTRASTKFLALGGLLTELLLVHEPGAHYTKANAVIQAESGLGLTRFVRISKEFVK